MGQNHKIDSDI